jgi:inosine-uridine nucleoside N-ribohydrolase
MNRIQTFLFITISFLCINSYSQPNIIFDTDFGGDADDLGALVMLNHFVNRNQCNLLAVMVWSTEEYAVPAVDAVNTFFGNPNIPLGVRKDKRYFEEWNYSKPIADAFKYNETYDSATEAKLLYRKILSKSKNKSVVIITVGPLKNIENLLNSPADSISPLSGKELVNMKVKEFVIMGGQFPEGKDEWNFNGNMPGVTRRVIENITSPIVFSGYELGLEIRTGEVFNKLNKNHPLYVGYLHFSSYAPWVKENFKGQILDNATYDQTAVLYAVKNGVGVYWDKIENGICVPDDNGGNKWFEKNDSNHSYLKLKVQKEEFAKLIDSFMLGEF